MFVANLWSLSMIIVIYFLVNISIKWVINVQNQPRVFQKKWINNHKWRMEKVQKKGLLQIIL